MNNYTLEFLSEEFGRHIHELDAILPGPCGDLNLAKAFKLIVDELLQLREGKNV